MIGIGRHTDYAARIVLHLASLDEGAQVTAAEISAKRLLPPAFVRRIMGKLADAGILRTTRGAGGGVTLARPARKITLLDVVKAMEGGLVLNACVDTPVACPLAVSCPVNKAWCDVTDTLVVSLGAVRFDRLANATELAVSKTGYPKRSGHRSQPTPPTGKRRSG
jgi:Rrf2 family protein